MAPVSWSSNNLIARGSNKVSGLCRLVFRTSHTQCMPIPGAVREGMRVDLPGGAA